MLGTGKVVTFLEMSRPWLTRLGFVLSAATAALVLRVSWDEPWVGVATLGLIFVLVLLQLRTRRKTRRVLRSGDVEQVLDQWSSTMDQVPHASTMGPLMTATAFAAYGWTDKAREALRQAERGPAWDAALEHRLFVDTLLLTFEGDIEEALRRAARLQQLPLPSAAPKLVEQVTTLRGAVGALARAFSHQSEQGDRQLLLDAGRHSPLVHWAMRYGAAIVSIDRGQLADARQLLREAPAWPAGSRFRRFHGEIVVEIDRQAGTADDEQRVPPLP